MAAKDNVIEIVSRKRSKKYPIRRSKYNVNKDLSSRTYKNVIYDSAMEMKYFIEVIEPMISLGYIKYYERQKKYNLLPSFKRNGKTVLAIDYVADYYIEYSNGVTEVIDVKGMPDDVAKLKRKLFWSRYPEIDYRWVTYNKSHGGWLDYDVLHEMKLKEAREKKAKNAQEEKDG